MNYYEQKQIANEDMVTCIAWLAGKVWYWGWRVLAVYGLITLLN